MLQSSLQLVCLVLLSPNYCMLPLLGGALQTLATETDIGFSPTSRQIRLSSPSTRCGWTIWIGWRQTISCLEIQPYSPLHRLLPSKCNKPYLTRGRVVYIITFFPPRLLLSMNVSLSVQSLFLDNPISIATV